MRLSSQKYATSLFPFVPIAPTWQVLANFPFLVKVLSDDVGSFIDTPS
jgi:hypothetical protein